MSDKGTEGAKLGTEIEGKQSTLVTWMVLNRGPPSDCPPHAAAAGEENCPGLADIHQQYLQHALEGTTF